MEINKLKLRFLESGIQPLSVDERQLVLELVALSGASLEDLSPVLWQLWQNNALAGKINFPVLVDYSFDYRNILSRMGLDYYLSTTKKIFDSLSCPPKTGLTELSCRLFSFEGEEVSSNYVITSMASAGYRQATVFELISFTFKYRDLIDRKNIASLDGLLFEGKTFIPSLHSIFKQRRFDWAEDSGWWKCDKGCFLGVNEKISIL
ncbi:MAG: hypothetical protein ACOYMB_05345 [Patescibacteria group bacterium]